MCVSTMQNVFQDNIDNYRHGYLSDPKDRVTAYCKPIYTQDGPNIYDH